MNAQRQASAAHQLRALIVLVLAGAIACGRSADAAAEQDAAGDTPASGEVQATAVLAVNGGDTDFVVAESTTVSAPLLLPSQVFVEQDAIVAARATGVLQSLSVDLGSSVSSGQVIGRLEDEAQRLTLARAIVAHDNAQKVAWRAKEMRNVEGISASDVEQAEFAFRMAEVAMREAELALERARIVAPFDGVITARYVQPGRLLALHDTLLRISARGPHLARVRVPESAAFPVRVGSEVVAVSTAGHRVPARVVRVSPAIDAASGTREIIVRISQPSGRSAQPLLTGSTVNVELSHGMRRALTLPRTAVDAGGYVIVVQGTRSILRPVITGVQDGDRIEVLGGLRLGERVRRHAR
jgi:membrane fusion protein, multidrug efflux system